MPSICRARDPSKMVVEIFDGIKVVRDDLFPGGTKARVLPALLAGPAAEYVYAGPVQGYAQVALAIAARACGKRATLFVAARAALHPRTAMAQAAGAKVVGVRPGYLSVVKKRAAAYCQDTGATLLPWGMDCPAMVNGIAALARGMGISPCEVWSVAGSGTLQRGLQQAWPGAKFYAVRIGAVPDAGVAALLQAPEKYEQPARLPPPFPSCDNYDAKAWQYIQALASPGALFWNVAG